MKNLTIQELKSNVFSGSDSFGRHYEVAIKDGSLFHRSYVYNGYGMGWSKWKLMDSFSGEFYISECNNYGNKEKLKWGFGCDAIGSLNNRLRLPKI